MRKLSQFNHTGKIMLNSVNDKSSMSLNHEPRREYVNKKYNYFYGVMLELWEMVSKQNLNHKNKLLAMDFILYSWSGWSAERWNSINEIYDYFEKTGQEKLKIFILQSEKIIKKNELIPLQSKSCLKFAFDDFNQPPDYIIELGGGVGHNLIRANQFFTSAIDAKNIHYINAEINKAGRTLSSRLFEDMSIETYSVLKFDYYEPFDLLQKLSKILKRNKKIHIFTLASIEQITFLDYNFFKMLKYIADVSSELKITFCEPVTWQLKEMLDKPLYQHNLELSQNRAHNKNLWSLIQQAVADAAIGIKICKVSPSVFRSDKRLDLAGIQVTF